MRQKSNCTGEILKFSDQPDLYREIECISKIIATLIDANRRAIDEYHPC